MYANQPVANKRLFQHGATPPEVAENVPPSNFKQGLFPLLKFDRVFQKNN
jgi:hypothetical protein